MRLTVKQITWLKVLLHLAGFLPVVWLFWAGHQGYFSADPAKDIQHFTGRMALKFLLATLLVSPLARYAKQPLLIGETCTVLEMAAGTWHAVLSLDTGGIIFEVKHGGYQPVAADDYAHWAPAEGEPGTTELMAWYAQAQVGDSTFAV
ncbi:hypothetical protein [Klebsiella michiganensis]|uniref:hypothetical protein n=1 Tax=Klebsiella michiganensis TaxID=1134687 RepID=UPI0034A0C206